MGRPRLSLKEELPVEEYEIFPEMPEVPEFWQKGSLLNVRATGDCWTITQMPDEFDWRYPERAMKIYNYGQCQDFVSHWYSRQHYDPRAY